MVALSLLAVLSAGAGAASLVRAHPATPTSEPPLPNRWYHDDDHPVHALFRRAGKRDAAPQVGSPTWSALYPSDSPDPSKLPPAWVTALKDAQSKGKIPDYPPAAAGNGETGQVPYYPPGVQENKNNATICNASDRECRIPGDIWDGPTGFFGVGFDDGPTPASPALYDFLQKNNVPSTHYFIGSNVLQNWQEFLTAYGTLKADLAVHTWTHPFMTTMSNEQVLGELGWTMQIIHDSTGGKIPRFWRPPYGDIDTRVSAIAREVFGMTAVMWNQDTDDWAMSSNPPGTNLDKIQSEFNTWLTGPKTPGLIVLEHELTNDTVQAFMNGFPLIGQNGWKIASQAQLNASMPVYQDGKEDDEAFNSYIVAPSASASAMPTSALSATNSSSAASASNSGLSTESKKSGDKAVLLFPSLATFGVLVGGVFALM